MKFKGLLLIYLLLPGCALLGAEPWVDTRDVWLRSDIEILSDIGVIKVPITTYPLMWAGIIKDIDNVDLLIKKYKQILVDDVTYQALRSLGKTGDSFNEVISHLLEEAKNCKQ